MIIDFHTHIFNPDICADRGPALADGQFRILYGPGQARLADHHALSGSMRASGVDRAVAMGFPWEREDRCTAQNEYFSRVRDESGGTILPFGSVPVNDTADPAPWVRRIKAAGLSGVGEVGFYREGMRPWCFDFLRALLAAVRDEEIPLCLHVNEPVGHSYPGKYDPALGELYAILADHPGATVILSHWGGGLLFYELMPEVAKALGHCFYDTAATPYLYSDTIYDMAVRLIDPRRILFGTDYPLLSTERYLEKIEKRVADSEARADILGGNAARLLHIR
jgi:uncharacterized protein